MLSLRAAWGDPQGGPALVHAQAQATVPDLATAEELGLQVAAQLRAGGAH